MRMFTASAVLALLMGAMSASAQAAPLRAWMCSTAECGGVDDIAAIDNVLNDLNPALGRMLIIDASGNETEIATSYPAAGSPSDPFLNLTYSLTIGSGNTQFLYTLQDEFTALAGTTMNFLANASAGTGVAHVFSATGAFSALVQPPGAPADLSCGPTAFTATVDATCSYGAPPPEFYAMIRLDVTADSTGVSSGDATLRADARQVAEPATIALFGLSLFGVSLASPRRRQAQG